MDVSTIKNSTPRECQRRIFIDSLYRELDKASAKAGHKNSLMMKRANELLFNDGLSKDACVDTLIIEGFDDKIARDCIESMASNETMEKESDILIQKYDYCFEDHRGRTFTGRELGNIVEASSEEDAKKAILATLSDFDPPVSLINVYKLG